MNKDQDKIIYAWDFNSSPFLMQLKKSEIHESINWQNIYQEKKRCSTSSTFSRRIAYSYTREHAKSIKPANLIYIIAYPTLCSVPLLINISNKLPFLQPNNQFCGLVEKTTNNLLTDLKQLNSQVDFYVLNYCFLALFIESPNRIEILQSHLRPTYNLILPFNFFFHHNLISSNHENGCLP